MSARRVRTGRHTPAGAALSQLISEAFQLNSRLLAENERLSSQASLSAARWQVLEIVAEAPMTVSWVARRLGLARQSVQRTVDVLVAEGWARLLDNPDHQRARLIELTPRGRSALTKVQSEHCKWSNRIARGFAKREIEAATLTLRQLRSQLDKGR